MRKILLLLVTFIAVMPLAASIVNGELSMVIVVPSYKNANWYQKNLDSICYQNYSNYHIIYTDDCSPDGTGDLVEAYIKERGLENRVTLIKNSVRRKAFANLYTMFYMCNDDDIVVTVDGDDWLANNDVLKYLNEVYWSGKVWMTYGQFAEYTGEDKKLSKGFNRLIPAKVLASEDGLRHQVNAFSHLRTFYAGLFKRLAMEDLMYEGEFLPMTWDLAMMIPMTEMARSHCLFIPEVLYIYNNANDINDHKVNRGLQHDLDVMIRAKKPYKKLLRLF